MWTFSFFGEDNIILDIDHRNNSAVLLFNTNYFDVKQEYEKKMVPWIWAFGIFTVFRLLAYLFFSIVNDMIFAYNIIICLLWTAFLVISIYGWILVYSLYIELTDLTKLEDLAHLRVSNEFLYILRKNEHIFISCMLAQK